MLLSDRRQEVSATTFTHRSKLIVTFFDHEFSKPFDEVSKTHTGGTPFRARLTGEAVPDGVAGDEIRIEKCLLDDPSRRLAVLDVTEKDSHRADRRTLATFEATREIALLDELSDLFSSDLHLSTRVVAS